MGNGKEGDIELGNGGYEGDRVVVNDEGNKDDGVNNGRADQTCR